MEKKKIAVLFGGCSSEYEVSLQSAYGVICHVNRENYTVYMIGLHRTTGQWFWYQGNPDRIAKDCWCEEEFCTPVYVPTDKRVHGVCYLKEGAFCVLGLDLVLPILHGKNGEDGTVQGALELAQIPVVGCGLLSSALCMDKELAHRVAAAAGVPVPAAILLQKPFEIQKVQQAVKKLRYPVFVKPVRAGSSFGITMVQTEEELALALKRAFAHDSKVLIEERILGREVGCAVIGTSKLLVGEVDEIELSDGFFDYTEKYTLKTSKIHVPARVDAKTAEQIKQTAQTIYQALGCSGFARVDMFLTDDGKIYFNEVNTIPGFTTHSRFPSMMQEAGYSFEEVLERILEGEA